MSRRLAQILELLDAAVLSVGFDNSIGGRQVDGCVGQSIWRIGGDSRGVSNLSPRLSLRRAKRARPEPTPANSLDL